MQRHQLLISSALLFILSANVHAQMPVKTKESKQTNVQSNTTDTPVASPTTVVPQPSYGGQPVLQFNTLGKPASSDDRNALKFKTVTDEKAGTTSPSTDAMANPVENIKNDAPYSIAVGYPRWEVAVALNPSSNGFKQDNNTLGTLNYTSTSPMGLDLSAKLIPNPEVYYQVSYNYQTVGVNDAVLAALFTIKESKAVIDSFLVGGGYCFIFNNFYNKLCPGFELGIDSYPSLDFTDNTNIQIAKIRDMVAGINLNWQYPVIYNVKFQSKLGYLSGLKIGQSSNLGVTKNSKMTLDAGFEWPIGTNKHITAMVNYVSRDASVEGKSGANTDTWTTKASMLAGKIGFAWEFDSGIR